MRRAAIEPNLQAVGRRLAARGVTGETLIVGASVLPVLCNRGATRDIGACFDHDKDAMPNGGRATWG